MTVRGFYLLLAGRLFSFPPPTSPFPVAFARTLERPSSAPLRPLLFLPLCTTAGGPECNVAPTR